MLTDLYPPDETEPAYMRLVIHVCVNCLERVAGQCHAPGCFYCRSSIEDVPTYLKMYVDAEGSSPDGD